MIGKIFELNFTVNDFVLTTKTKIEGLNSEILFNLFDIARKWGQLSLDKMLGVPSFDEDGFTIATHYEKAGLFVAKRSPEIGPNICATGKGTELLETFSGLHIIWDGRVSIEEAKETIKKWDEFGKKEGWINDNGERVYCQTIGDEIMALLH